MPIDEYMYLICLRPRAYFSRIETTRDLIFFIRGFVTGAYPPHTSGSGIGGDFIRWLYRRHGRTPPEQLYVGTHDFATVLLEEYGDKPLAEAHEAIARLFREYREAQPQGTDSWVMKP